MPKMTYLRDIYENLKKASENAQTMAMCLRLRDDYKLGPVMTLGGGDLEQNKKDYNKYVDIKGKLHKLLVDEINNLTGTIDKYYSHLKEKMERNGYIINEVNGEYEPGHNSDKCLENRFHALREMKNIISDLDPNPNQSTELPDQLTILENQFATCRKNKPSWSEIPFLKKLIDILLSGFTVGFRGFFSKENSFQNSLGEKLTTSPRL